MTNVRLIARLDIKGPNLIKGVHLEGLRVIGDPQEYARRYYEQGADEVMRACWPQGRVDEKPDGNGRSAADLGRR